MLLTLTNNDEPLLYLHHERLPPAVDPHSYNKHQHADSEYCLIVIQANVDQVKYQHEELKQGVSRLVKYQHEELKQGVSRSGQISA